MIDSRNTLTLRDLLAAAAAVSVACSGRLAAEPDYDVLLRGGHVIDPENGLSAVCDLAVRDGNVAAIAETIDPGRGFKVVDCAGLYVTPGLINFHTHVFAGTNEANSCAGDNSVFPDGFTFRTGVTTVVDAGCAGWRNFDVCMGNRDQALLNAGSCTGQHRREWHARGRDRAGLRRHAGLANRRTR